MIEIPEQQHAFVIDQGYTEGNNSTIVVAENGNAVSIMQDDDVILISKSRIAQVVSALNKLK